MGMLVENSDGTYTLKVKIGCIEINKAFKEIPLEEATSEPEPDGFYLNIPDVK